MRYKQAICNVLSIHGVLVPYKFFFRDSRDLEFHDRNFLNVDELLEIP